MIITAKQTNEEPYKMIFVKDTTLTFYGTENKIIKYGVANLYDYNNNLLSSLELNISHSIINSIPFKIILGGKKKDIINVIKDEKIIGEIYCLHKPFSRKWILNFENHQRLLMYTKSIGSLRYFSIYLNDVQIAMIVKNNVVENNSDNYLLYLLDEYNQYSTILIETILYLDNYYYGRQLESFRGVNYNLNHSFSITDKYYNKDWIKDNFNCNSNEAKNTITSDGIDIMVNTLKKTPDFFKKEMRDFKPTLLILLFSIIFIAVLVIILILLTR